MYTIFIFHKRLAHCQRNLHRIDKTERPENTAHHFDITHIYPSTRGVAKRFHTCAEYQSPVLRCPPDIVVEVPPNDSRAHVHITAARTDVDWERNVRAQPAWAKRTDVQLPVGYVNVTLTATHPLAPELSVTCAFGITVLGNFTLHTGLACMPTHQHIQSNAWDARVNAYDAMPSYSS